MSSTMRRIISLVAVLALVATVALVAVAALRSDDGAGDPESADPTATSPSGAAPTIDVDQRACALLSAADRERLSGVPLDDIVAAEGTGAGSQCRWQADEALVQVTTLPAEEWAKTLPEAVSQMGTSGDLAAEDMADLARVERLLDGVDSFSGDQACDVFVQLSEIGGSPAGTTTTVTTLPITETEVGLSAQTCSGGALTSLIYSVPGLTDDEKSQRAVRRALEAAQARVVR